MTIADCVCKPGFRSFQNNECEIVTCPTQSAPNNGYLINCLGNMVNAECEIRCAPGYSLVGSGKRSCLADGSWSGNATQCVLRK